ncbi:MAG: hypothetical protein LBU24_03180 [Methanocalculaceae archaeon]|jgi:hypothetical protein|nr:hypothetical protein [Methanocalculaceae archaeon]
MQADQCSTHRFELALLASFILVVFVLILSLIIRLRVPVPYHLGYTELEHAGVESSNYLYFSDDSASFPPFSVSMVRGTTNHPNSHRTRSVKHQAMFVLRVLTPADQ